MSAGATPRGIIATRCVCCDGASLAKAPAVLMPFVAHRALGWEPVRIDESWGMRTLEQGMAYSVCNSIQCQDCGFLFLDIRFTDSELAALYSGYREQAYTDLRERYEPGYALRNEGLNAGVSFLDTIEAFIAPHIPFPAKILDWGGDTGKNTPFRRDDNIIHIYEISDKDTLSGTSRISKAEIAGQHYDLVISSHVLEHVPYPGDVIAEMVTAMGDDTLLYIETPYEDVMSTANGASDLYLKKRHWHEHINFFSRTSLERLLETNGLEQIAYNELAMTGGANCRMVFQILCRKRRSTEA